MEQTMLRFVAWAAVSAVIVALWAWLGVPVSPLPGSIAKDKLYCISYAPFRADQTPLDLSTRIDAAQIDDDLARLARLTDCVRTYSTSLGLDRIAEVAARHRLKVIQGIWLGGTAERNRQEIADAVAIARRFPDVVRALVVGNEVLLRGEMSAVDLAATIRSVKSQVSVPVTYADVWEFWLRNRDLAQAADFITIHILPYWEDFPVAAGQAAAHVKDIRRQVAEQFPGRDILIGEVGWPSAGRMREGALPSPSNQMRVLEGVLRDAREAAYNVNIIEAFDQPWKRWLEGTVGGHWGLLTARSREPKFAWAEAVSNHPYWMAQAAAGVVLALCIFAAASPRRSKQEPLPWLGVAAIALSAGSMLGWAVENAVLESLGAGGIARSAVFLALAVVTPLFTARALVRGVAAPVFARVLNGPFIEHAWLERALGINLIVVLVLAIHVALGLVFDPRYKDFPFAPMTAAIVPFAVLSFLGTRSEGRRGVAEITAAGLLIGSAAYFLPNEGFENWQSVWVGALIVLLAITLYRLRDARS